jgi:hypothetical protein
MSVKRKPGRPPMSKSSESHSFHGVVPAPSSDTLTFEISLPRVVDLYAVFVHAAGEKAKTVCVEVTESHVSFAVQDPLDMCSVTTTFAGDAMRSFYSETPCRFMLDPSVVSKILSKMKQADTSAGVTLAAERGSTWIAFHSDEDAAASSSTYKVPMQEAVEIECASKTPCADCRPSAAANLTVAQIKEIATSAAMVSETVSIFADSEHLTFESKSDAAVFTKMFSDARAIELTHAGEVSTTVRAKPVQRFAASARSILATKVGITFSCESDLVLRAVGQFVSISAMFKSTVAYR